EADDGCEGNRYVDEDEDETDDGCDGNGDVGEDEGSDAFYFYKIYPIGHRS
ncbi:7812_t:CDS:2, partial [Racocetra fulgida]